MENMECCVNTAVANDSFCGMPDDFVGPAMPTYSFVIQSDWLKEHLSSIGEGVGDKLVGAEEEFDAFFNLNVNHIVEKAFSHGGGKRRWRKPKRNWGPSSLLLVGLCHSDGSFCGCGWLSFGWNVVLGFAVPGVWVVAGSFWQLLSPASFFAFVTICFHFISNFGCVILLYSCFAWLYPSLFDEIKSLYYVKKKILTPWPFEIGLNHTSMNLMFCLQRRCSMATPHVTSLAALLNHIDPIATNDMTLIYDIQPHDHIHYLYVMGLFYDKQLSAIV
ncbi:hypothetical protein IEQ34_004990 [Dendrobium chrysotoxum]|uniref:Uncharacterized protein n=1 Tax=Dendrobium chrysotoxum TaxID=161865 RepID=A0AAV7H8V7_DENCH|nr:hypothetical protein IEQ34_004990 [Dendrobium chrysotoxum]